MWFWYHYRIQHVFLEHLPICWVIAFNSFLFKFRHFGQQGAEMVTNVNFLLYKTKQWRLSTCSETSNYCELLVVAHFMLAPFRRICIDKENVGAITREISKIGAIKDVGKNRGLKIEINRFQIISNFWELCLYHHLSRILFWMRVSFFRFLNCLTMKENAGTSQFFRISNFLGPIMEVRVEFSHVFSPR